MPVHYLCDSCGYRGVDPDARTADEVLCEVCGEVVLQDPDAPADDEGHNGPRGSRRRPPGA